MINIFTRSSYKINRQALKREIALFLKEYGFSENDYLNIIFVGQRKMREIAKRYKKEDLALPVLSFSYLPSKEKTSNQVVPQEDNLVGEIFICYPQAILLAAERGKEVDAIIIELIKHGIENIMS